MCLSFLEACNFSLFYLYIIPITWWYYTMKYLYSFDRLLTMCGATDMKVKVETSVIE